MIPTMKQIISSADELIRAFGGPSKLALLLCLTQGRVSQWKADGIPTGWHMRLARMAEARGLVVDDRVWGLEDFDPHAPMEALTEVRAAE